MIYIRGDLHAKFDPLFAFARARKTSRDDLMIVLGDAGINFHGEEKDRQKKERLRELPLTLLAIHGNHDMRPQNLPAYEERPFRGGTVFVEAEFPHLLFAKDGSVFDFDGKQSLVIGGAYSIDKALWLLLKWPWFPDEQPSAAIRGDVEAAVAAHANTFDYVLTHTSPLSEVPFPKQDRELPVPIDLTTERWLDEIRASLTFERWYAGHFHKDETRGKFTFLFEDTLLLGEAHPR